MSLLNHSARYRHPTRVPPYSQWSRTEIKEDVDAEDVDAPPMKLAEEQAKNAARKEEKLV
jgi:hypothetical protein